MLKSWCVVPLYGLGLLNRSSWPVFGKLAVWSCGWNVEGATWPCCPVPPAGQGFADSFPQTGKTKVLKIMQQSKGRAFLHGSWGDCPCVVPAGLREKLWLAGDFICRPDAEWEEVQKRWTARGKRSMKSPFLTHCLVKKTTGIVGVKNPQSSELPRPPLPEQKDTVAVWSSAVSVGFSGKKGGLQRSPQERQDFWREKVSVTQMVFYIALSVPAGVAEAAGGPHSAPRLTSCMVNCTGTHCTVCNEHPAIKSRINNYSKLI